MRKNIKIVFLIIKSLILFIVIGALTTASVKNVQKIILVNEFISKGVYQPELSTEAEKHYIIYKSDELPSYTINNKEILPGYEGDIIVSTEATLFNPIISGVVSFFAGGHATICMNKYRDYEISVDDYQSVEITGVNMDENPAINNRNYWVTQQYFNEVIGLRVKMTKEQREEIISLATSYIGDPYNYTFLFDTTNKSYCSDLVSKVFGHIGFDLNKDDFTTSIYDLIVTNETYISYYHYFDSNGVKHIYYFG